MAKRKRTQPHTDVDNSEAGELSSTHSPADSLPSRGAESALVAPSSPAQQARPDSRPAPAAPAQDTSTAAAIRRKRRFPPRALKPLLVLASLALLVLALSPRLLQWTPIRSWALGQLSKNLPGRLEVDGIQLRWFGRQAATQVRWLEPALDDSGDANRERHPIVHIEAIEWDRSLWQVLKSRHDLGTLFLRGVKVHTHVRPGGSNLEDLLAAFPSGSSTSTTLPQLRILVEDGTVIASRQGQAESPRWARFQGELIAGAREPAELDESGPLPSSAESWRELTRATEGPWLTGRFLLSMESSTALPTEEQPSELAPQAPLESQPGSLSITVNWAPAPATAAIQVSANQLSLPWLDLAATRCGSSCQVDGQMSGSMLFLGTLAPPAPTWTLAASLEADPITLANLLPTNDTIRSESTRCDLVLRTASQQCQIEKAHLSSDWGSVDLRGSLALDDTSMSSSTLSWILASPGELNAVVNVPAFFRQLPETLHAHPELQWTGGEMNITLVNSTAGAAPRFNGQFQIAGLAATHRERRLAMSAPAEIQFLVTGSGDDLTLEELRATTPFLSATAEGTRADGQITVAADLDELQRELSQFVDFRGYTLAGKSQAKVHWSSGPQGSWQARAEGLAERLLVQTPQAVRSEEPRLRLVFEGSGARAESARSRAVQLAAATLEISGIEPTDRLRVSLLEPLLVGQGALPAGSCQLDVSGDLASWQRRIRWFVPQPLPNLAGQIRGNARLAMGVDQIDIRDCEATIRQFQWERTGQPPLHEPIVQVTGRGSYRIPTGSLVCEEATLASTMVSVRAEGLVWPPASNLQENGQFHYRGDLTKIWQRALPQATSRILGQVQGRLQLAPTAEGIRFRAQQAIQDFRWQTASANGAQNYVDLWQENSVTTSAAGSYHPQDDRLQIDAAELQIPDNQVALAGSVRQVSGRMEADLRGETQLDLEKLSQRLRPWLGANLSLRGTSTEPFTLSGPLRTLSPDTAASATQFTSLSSRAGMAHETARNGSAGHGISPDLRGQSGLRWDQIDAWGFSANAGTLQVSLAEQRIDAAPMEIPVSGGRVRLAPSLLLTPPYRLTLPPGVLADRVEISPEMCHGWLKYVAPLLADATAAQGQLSLKLAEAVVPLEQPTAATIAGSISIHQAQVGPGPLAQEILGLAQQIQAIARPQSGNNLAGNGSWLVLPEHQVSYRVDQGRVAHDGLTMTAGDVTIRTRGWVSFDQQLHLIAMVPIQESWVRDQRWLAGLRGQTLEIPIQGTLQRPVLDRRALSGLAEQTLRSAAEGALQQEFQRQLNRFLPIP